MKINKKILIVILNILNGLLVVPSIQLWMLIGYMHDIPYASHSLIKNIFVYLALAIPVIVLTSTYFVIKSYKSGKDSNSFKISILTFAYLLLVIFGFILALPLYEIY